MKLFIKILTTVCVLSSSLLAAKGNGATLMYKSDNAVKIAEHDMLTNGQVSPTNLHNMTKREFYFLLKNEDMPQSESVTYDGSLAIMPYFSAFRVPDQEFKKLYPNNLLYINYMAPPLFSLQGGLGLGDYFYVTSDINLRANKEHLNGLGMYNPIGGEYAIAGESPTEGYLSFSASHFSATFGRFQSGIGEGFLGNTFLNSKAPWYDQLQFVIFTKKVKIYYAIGGSSAFLTEEEYNLQNQKGDIEDNDYYSREDYTADHMKSFIYHRIELTPFRNFKIGAGEMNLVGGKFPEFNQLNPVQLYHNTYDQNHRAYMFMADLNYVPVNGVLLYCEGLINELKLANERSAEVTATGQQIGIKFALGRNSSYKHSLAIEGTHIDQYTYIDYVPYATMYQRLTGVKYFYDVPLGYQHGGDLIQYGLNYQIVAENDFTLDIKIHRLHKGDNRMGLNEEGRSDYNGNAHYNFMPSGTIEYSNTVETTMNIPVYGNIVFEALLYYSYIENYLNVEGNDQNLFVTHLALGYKI